MLTCCPLFNREESGEPKRRITENKTRGVLNFSGEFMAVVSGIERRPRGSERKPGRNNKEESKG